METCAISGCSGKTVGRGWCRKHYGRWHRTGDPLFVHYEQAQGTPEERWHAKVEKTDGCWLWTGGKDKFGYGQFDVKVEGKHRNHRAHRWGYEMLVRPLAADETLDHLCRVHGCVNPAHLDPVAHAENVARGNAGARNREKTSCKHGHPFTPENTRIRADNGQRICLACQRERNARRN